MSLNKSNIAKKISKDANISRTSSKIIVDSFFQIIKSQSNNKDIKIANFGTFTNKLTPQRIGRNPNTGTKHIITERLKLSFIVSNKVKKQLN